MTRRSARRSDFCRSSLSASYSHRGRSGRRVAADTVSVLDLLLLSAHPAGESLYQLRTLWAVPYRAGLFLPFPHKADYAFLCPSAVIRSMVEAEIRQLASSSVARSPPCPSPSWTTAAKSRSASPHWSVWKRGERTRTPSSLISSSSVRS